MKKQAGMTLIEVMVALVVALAGLAVMQATLQQPASWGGWKKTSPAGSPITSWCS
jgi:general secretion pathway protein I